MSPRLMFSSNRIAQPRYQYRPLGSLRLVLAALVMLQHFAADLAPEQLARAFAPYAVGSIAVLVFFAMSGFVITEAIDCVYRGRPGAFLGNRMLRIVPHFVLALVLSMLAHKMFQITGGVQLWRSQPVFPSEAFAAANVALNFIGILPLVDRFIDYNFLDITWAVRVEMAFYLIMGACIVIGWVMPRKRGFAEAASGTLVLLVPLFLLAIHGRGISMLGFLPYFAFGSGLYFATAGSRTGWLVAAVSMPAMLWQCIAQPPGGVAPGAVPPSLSANLIVLLILLSSFTALAFSRISRWRHVDRLLGSLTYPLYLYHEDVFVFLRTITVGYSYGTFVAGIVLSLLAAAMLTALVDPLVNRYRDKVRGSAIPRGPQFPGHPAGAMRQEPTFRPPIQPFIR